MATSGMGPGAGPGLLAVRGFHSVLQLLSNYRATEPCLRGVGASSGKSCPKTDVNGCNRRQAEDSPSTLQQVYRGPDIIWPLLMSSCSGAVVSVSSCAPCRFEMGRGKSVHLLASQPQIQQHQRITDDHWDYYELGG